MECFIKNKKSEGRLVFNTMIERGIYRLLLVAALMSQGGLFAQVGRPIDQPSKKPVLIDDIHSDKIENVRRNLDHERLSVTKRISDLTAKQRRSILCLEKNRDREIKQIDNRILTLNQNPPAQQKGSQAEIARLQAKRCQIMTLYRKKIRTVLNGKQKREFDRIYLK